MKSFKLYFLFFLIPLFISGQNKKDLSVIAYYMGDDKQIDEFDVSKLTHIIFSFCHLKDGKLNVENAKDSTAIKHLVSLKDKNPKLKIMLSLGGWSGCEPCSAVFAVAEKRAIFAKSVKDINAYFKCDGLDLDWEYPAIEGYPGHLYQMADKKNFTELVISLRKELGTKNELSFAAGGFQKYLDESIEWEKVMPLVNRVNIMSYDLVNGYSKVTGHHTPLFSTNTSEESTNRAVEYLLKLGIPAKKLVIGAAFYTRVWKEVANVNNGLYQSGVATNGIDFKDYETTFVKEKGWSYYWDEKAKAPYWYNEKEKLFATGDDIASVKEKTNYLIKKKLGGIMFWELTLDKKQNGMLDTIDEIKKSK
ncbi:glycoside hydrolase family 18 protein [Flavobacterium sp. 5]|uniref:glycoside hydrolase family 18 protein n=1 Tax=Flavobacterium sp. 5 TaxID=2035199 RepID=UPI000C2C17B6|nr:glycoside hydrolase family 18 protein [Flavobacterium sp. 5]PKB18935.1 chitinase [Flavobacterium sp. 5]